MFTHAIVRTPCRAMVNGITTVDLGTPDYERAIAQHADYVVALKECGLNVTVLPADERFPDSTFVEDVALMTPRCAVLTRPGALTRLGESALMEQILTRHYAVVAHIKAPGTVEAGDIMMVGTHFYIGLSARTNQAGADQLIAILQNHGMTGSTVHLSEVLHLKTGVSYLEDNHLLVAGEFQTRDGFQSFNRINVDADEAYAANCVWINNRVLVPQGFPKTKNLIEAAGFSVREVAMSEFQKIDGGLSCLSLRF